MGHNLVCHTSITEMTSDTSSWSLYLAVSVVMVFLRWLIVTEQKRPSHYMSMHEALEKCSWFNSLITSGMIWRRTASLLLVNNLPLFLSSLAHFSVCSVKGCPFIIEKDSFVFYTLSARFQDQIQHFYGKLQSFWLMKSKDVQNNPGDPQLWRTGGVLHCCHCSSGRKERVRRTPGEKITISVQKGPEKQHFFTGSGKVEENLFHLQTKTILAWLFPLDAFSHTGPG